MASVTAVVNSGNQKLGSGGSVTYRAVGPTCPPSCPLLGAGCYAQRGRVNIHSIKARRRRINPADEVAKLDGAPRVRWDVSGDNFEGSSGEVDHDYIGAKYDWHARNLGAISLGYTHDARALTAAGYGPETHPTGFNFLASTESRRDARELREEGWRTARVVASESTQRDEVEHLCPVDLAKHRGEKVDTDCAKCRLCWGPEHQEKSIVFIKF